MFYVFSGLHVMLTIDDRRILLGRRPAFDKGTCSVAATYKPPMLVPRVRLPAGAFGALRRILRARAEVRRASRTRACARLVGFPAGITR